MGSKPCDGGKRKTATRVAVFNVCTFSLWVPDKKYWHGQPPLLFGERVGVRGNMRTPCGLREPHEKLARSAPSPLWGEGWGEGKHATSLWAEGAPRKIGTVGPSPLWGEGWGEGKHATSLWAEGAPRKNGTVGPLSSLGRGLG